MAARDESNFRQSTLREKIIEHIFVAELLKSLWKAKTYDVEVARPEIDTGGADLIVSQGKFVRHVQLKSSGTEAKTRRQNVNVALGTKASGCVVWIRFDMSSLSLKEYQWYGDKPGRPLPSLSSKKVAKHTRANSRGKKAGRPAIRVLRYSDFTHLSGIEEVIRRLLKP
jgi:hypothetical protein